MPVATTSVYALFSRRVMQQLHCPTILQTLVKPIIQLDKQIGPQSGNP